jgi:hypothetical protein
VRRNRSSSITSTTVNDLAVVAQDMLRMGKHWTQAAQDWLDANRNESAERRRQACRSPRDMQSDYSGGGYDQVRTPGAAAGFGAPRAGAGYRGVGPRNYSRSDERIREDINERLTEADDLDASDITVEVSQGVVTLNGGVGERWMKHRAEDLADGCIGVRDVRNQVQVRGGRDDDSASGGMDASGGVRVGSSEVSGSLHTNIGNSAGGDSPGGTRTTGSTGTPHGTGTNTHQN